MNRVGHHSEGRWTYGALLCAIVIASATGCASGQRAQRESEMATLRAQVEDLRKRHDASARERAQLSADIKALEAQSTFLVGEARTASNESQRTATKIEEQNQAIVALRSAIDELRKPAAVPVPPPPPAKPAPQSAAPEASPEQIFASAMTSFQAEEHGQAVLEWTELIRRFPEHPLASSAQYWIGEAYYRQRDFRQAMLEFRRVIDVYPKSAQTPEALLKIGLCQRALRDVAHARETWEQLAKEYPGTNAATQARSLLGGPGRGTRPGR
jgi:tol-pal system protein YbgF